MAGSKDEWNNFVLFDGWCKLGREILRPGPTLQPAEALQPEDILKESVKKFDTWIRLLYTELINSRPCGIPTICKPSVIELLKVFFAQNNGEPDYTAIRCKNDPSGKPNYIADPITVSFSNGSSIDITDGPAALGYIFSVAATPETKDRTWDTYVVPLLTLYTRCVYLAYVGYDSEEWDPAPGRVPYMTSAMYFEGSPDTHCWLGSCYTTGPDHKSRDVTFDKGKRRMMNGWRAEKVLVPALQFEPPDRAFPQPGELLAPTLAEAVCEGILKILQSSSLAYDPDPVKDLPLPAAPDEWTTVLPKTAQDAFDDMEKLLRDAWKQTPAGAAPIATLDREMIWNMTKTTLPTELRKALMGVFRLRWSPGYDRDQPDIDEAFNEVCKIYFMPHFFAPKAPKGARGKPKVPGGNGSTGNGGLVPGIPDPAKGTAAEEPEPVLEPNLDLPIPLDQIPGYDELCLKVISQTYKAHRGPILDMLDRFHSWVQSNNEQLTTAGQSIPRYGRCAETYPVACLLPKYNPYRVFRTAGESKASLVKGFAFQARSFYDGEGMKALAENFDRQRLNELHRESAFYRLPCRNCQSLLPYAGVPVGDAYNSDLKELKKGPSNK